MSRNEGPALLRYHHRCLWCPLLWIGLLQGRTASAFHGRQGRDELDITDRNSTTRQLRTTRSTARSTRFLENDATYTPVFMFAGQSNIVGHPYETACSYTTETGKGECYLNEPYVFDTYVASGITPNDIRGQDLQSLVQILGPDGDDELPYKKTLDKLRDESLLRVATNFQDDVEIADWQAATLLDLKSKYPTLFSDMLATESDHVYCSWTHPAPIGAETDLQEGKKLSIKAGCGGPWGLEQSFGRTLPTFGEDSDFAIVKVGQGGTTMKLDWTKRDPSDPSSGHCLDAFIKQARNIAGAHPNCPREGGGDGNAPCKWQGLVFFQGENDAFLETADAKLYGLGLKKFIETAREELFEGGADPFYASASEIPVVIVQLGCWPETLTSKHGQYIMRRQKQFVKQDENSALVETKDLSCFYHFDTASHIIIGERVAMAMDGLLKQHIQRPSGGSSNTLMTASFGCSSIKNDLCYTNDDCCEPLTCNKLHRCKPTNSHRGRAPLIDDIFDRSDASRGEGGGILADIFDRGGTSRGDVRGILDDPHGLGRHNS
eukprot:CAMPEP_0194049576 /NCGR_PEP_ID=MMETSP0009_2-20130614/30764_1 /TAXON_ID=210454 /ORGANISM="Grammatophora oceanica, Strain CCMP 410" /LENGTH=547 /DNA_ID=CAMNT_0038695771 /DNA_START=169 /DNA_END=1812 /DNA_ORIENTATION=-